MPSLAGDVERGLQGYFPEPLRQTLVAAIPWTAPWQEVRLRVGQPLALTLQGGMDTFLSDRGEVVVDSARARRVSAGEVTAALERMTGSSVYAWERQLAQGFFTLPGGHRVGLGGRVVEEGGRIAAVHPVASLNVRVARDVFGAADAVLPFLVTPEGSVRSVLIVSPPGAGKTTLLRDLVRQVSQGRSSLGLRGLRVALVDERGEVAGSRLGMPERDVGPRTDVLDGCPKAAGLVMVLRSLGPQVIACDEVWGAEDASALLAACRAGVAVFATAHGSVIDDVLERSRLGPVVEAGGFEVVVVLSSHQGPGTVERIERLERRAAVREPSPW